MSLPTRAVCGSLFLTAALLASACASAMSTGLDGSVVEQTTSSVASEPTSTTVFADEVSTTLTTAVAPSVVPVAEELVTLGEFEAWPSFGFDRFWFIEQGRLEWFDPRDQTSGVLVDEGVEPTLVGFGAGRVWFLSGDALGAADPDTGVVAMVPTIELVSGESAAGWGFFLVFDADGDSALIVPLGPIDDLVRVSADGEVLNLIDLGLGTVIGHSVGSDGDHWVVSLPGDVFRLDAETFEVISETEIADTSHPVVLVDDELWVGDGGAVSIIDTETGEVVDSLVSTSALVSAVYPDGMPGLPLLVDGGVWVGDVEPGMLQRIDPATRTVEATVDLTEDPYVVVFADGDALWLSTVGGNVQKLDGTTGEVLWEGQLPDSEKEPSLVPTFFPSPDGLWVLTDSDNGFEIHELIVD